MSTNTTRSSKRINPFLIAIVALLIVVLLVCLIVPKASQATPTLLLWIIGISVLTIIVLIVPFCLFEMKRPNPDNVSKDNSTFVPKLEEPHNNVEKPETNVGEPTVSKFKKFIARLKNSRKSKK